jgi:hypothetical protein
MGSLAQRGSRCLITFQHEINQSGEGHFAITMLLS